MTLLSFGKISLRTTSTVEEVQEILEQNTEKNSLFNMFKASKKYQGKINNDSFKISRIISYTNSFLPILHGTFYETEHGTEITVKHRSHIFVLLFFVFWAIGFAGPSITTMIKGELDLMNLGFLIIALIMFGLIPLFIYIEKSETEQNFKKMFRDTKVI